MELIRKRAGSGPEIQKEGELVYLTFPELIETNAADHLFTTRFGGASSGHFSSMNLSYTRGDEKACVDENFRRIANLLGMGAENFVLTDQTHTANVRRVGTEDCGKGIVRPKDYRDVDALVTNEPGVVLSAFFADCVPLYFIDPVKRAIGLAHSGWRGTVQKIGKNTVEKMQEEFGSRQSDIKAAIGPSICNDCYEVSEDVAEAFRGNFQDTHSFLHAKGGGKYQLDLWEANRQVLLEAGISEKHISVTNLCICCNPKLFFSHRVLGEKRGNMGAFLVLRKN